MISNIKGIEVFDYVKSGQYVCGLNTNYTNACNVKWFLEKLKMFFLYINLQKIEM